jgi:hypothetical protein
LAPSCGTGLELTAAPPRLIAIRNLAFPLVHADANMAVFQHLHVLEASGLVRSEKAGRVRTCRIEPAALQSAEKWITERRMSWERRLDRLGQTVVSA